MPTVIQVKRGTASSWTSANTVLAAGEIGFETDTKKMKVGDGSTAWTSLGYTATDGDISSVVAGTGLSGGGTSGAVTLNLSTPVATTNGGTGLSSFTTGDLVYASGSNTLAARSIGSTGQVLTVSGGLPTWSAPAGFGTLTAYTPTWTGITIGNGTFQDVGYSQSGDLVWYFGQFQWGSTTTTSGIIQLSLPVNGLGTASNVDGKQPAANFGAICDTSTGYIYNYAVTLENATPATKFNLQSLLTNGTYIQNTVQYIQQTVPITFALNDVIAWNFFYRKA